MTGLAPNARSHLIEASATLAITATAAKLKAAGHDVVSLGAGEPDFPTPAPIAQAGIEAIEQGNYRYTAAAGTPELRAAGAKWFQSAFDLKYDASEVMVCSGAKSALHMAMAAIVEPNDAILILAPYWVSYPALVTLAGGKPVIVPANPARNFVHTADAIEAAAEESNAKGIIINFPNNPSGATPDSSDLQALVDLCIRRDLWIVSDEIYSTLLYDDISHLSPAAFPGGRERTVVVNGFTKSHTLTGWRTSFMAAPKDIIDTAIQSLGLADLSPFDVEATVLGMPTTRGELTGMEIHAFTDEVSRDSPAPGGGSIAALAGSLGAALSSMVANLTFAKRKYRKRQPEMEELARHAQKLKNDLLLAVDEDTAAFEQVLVAMRLPQGNPEAFVSVVEHQGPGHRYGQTYEFPSLVNKQLIK